VRLPLRKATLRGARLTGAQMAECDCRGLVLPGAAMDGADLRCADLTGAVLSRASLDNARLRQVCAADVDLSGASLRDADLTGMTFHMGSSRSGLLSSPIASEGSRTGFYADDLLREQYVEPEEFREANLTGVDLRGAVIDFVDFYLVDLRGALYDDGQAEQLRRTGAILGELV